MTRKEQVQLIKKLRLKKGENYLIFISRDSGLSYADLEGIPLPDKTIFVFVEGNVNNLLKVVEVSKGETNG